MYKLLALKNHVFHVSKSNVMFLRNWNVLVSLHPFSRNVYCHGSARPGCPEGRCPKGKTNKSGKKSSKQYPFVQWDDCHDGQSHTSVHRDNDDDDGIDRIDEEIDKELERFKKYLSETGKSVIDLPDTSLAIDKGLVQLSGGKMTDPRSIVRKGKILYNQCDKCQVLGDFELEKLEARYNRFNVNYAGRNMVGSLMVRAPENRIFISLSAGDVSNGEPCFSLTDHLVAVHLGQLNVDTTGRPFMNWIVTSKISSVINKNKRLVVDALQENIFGLLRDYRCAVKSK